MHARNAQQHHDSEGINTTVSSIDGRQANLFNRQLYTTLYTRADDDCSTNTVLHATPTIARVSSIKSRNGTLTTVRRQHLSKPLFDTAPTCVQCAQPLLSL